MATAAIETPPIQRERAFYFYMSLAILMTCVAGFGFFFAIGASSFASPWWVHVHAVSMSTWVALYVAQNYLVYRGALAGHRQLGVLAAAWSVWIVVVGLVVTIWVIAAHRLPPFFTPNFFLVMDWFNIVAFAGLAWNALRLRARSDWHKRLMFGAMVQLIAVAWGRLVLPILFDQRGMWLILVILLCYIGAAMAFDKRVHGKVHPAHYWSAGTLVGWVVLAFAAANLPPVVAYANALSG
ncbi:hypothetical protein GRI89_15100 [Altererythrobacter salegens]|uniref:Uncharacterized protein n=1 Tax=Croceibacterium salegens TaxID=1737568 RepID=A0A6I4SZS2_9SPHN|nr:hypothetical protein [Croceibacterium salegens]MXO60868.1 hypothetical protein [Croceibacterium salegens]